ncbi:MAG: universal stress protein [Chloroflexi bacterium]|nr:universal stress protein [Chloroflexota bacterium]
MYPTILVPLDGSELAETILPVARDLARRSHAPLLLLRIAARGANTEAAAYLHKQASALQAAGCEAATVVRSGPVAETILAHADEVRADLIAMSTHGRGGLSRVVMGSVADRVVRGGRMPVVLVRAGTEPRGQFALRRILAPVDGTPLAEQSLVHAQRLAGAFDAEVLLLSIWDGMGYQLGSFPANELEMKKQEEHAIAKYYIIETTHRLQKQGVRVHWKLLSGHVSQCIVETARANGSDLIVMATHGLTGISRMVEGSIADEVLRTSPVPLLLVRGIAPQ